MDISDLNIPGDLVPLGLAGQGRRSVTYRAKYRDGLVALKVYRAEFIEKYQRRHGVNIGQFEFDRNQAFYDIEALRPYAARPVGLLGIDDGYDLCLLQEFIEGLTLVELAQQKRGLPASVLDTGRLICEKAEENGLHDLDLFYRNVMVRKCQENWLPVLHDFNLFPQYMQPPNPFLALAYLTGLRKKSHRDWRCLKGWQAYSDLCREQPA